MLRTLASCMRGRDIEQSAEGVRHVMGDVPGTTDGDGVGRPCSTQGRAVQCHIGSRAGFLQATTDADKLAILTKMRAVIDAFKEPKK